MKVYVKEKDIDVIEGLFDATHCYECWECNRDDNLEIVSLADYTKQVRKEVCEEIRKKLPDFIYNFQEPETPRTKVVELEDIKYILDQIQGETNG